MHQTNVIIIKLVILFVSVPSILTSTIVETRTITEKQGRDVTLSCRFEYLHDRDRVMWSKDGIVLSMNNDISGDRNKYLIQNKYDLTIKKLDQHDTGRYLCQNFDQFLSINVALTVLIRPTKPELNQANQSLIENGHGQFVCSTKGGNPLPSFYWFINQMKINESFFRVTPNTHQSTSELSLPLEKRFHNGLLTCQVHNQALESPLMASQTLNIQFKPEVTLHYGQTIVNNLNLLVVENDPVIIDCQTQSNPPLTRATRWLKHRLLLSDVTGTALRFPTIKRNDHGEYTCAATNPIGQTQSSVDIRVQYPPVVRLNGGGLINENQRLILICHADSYPPIDSYEWFRNNERLNTSSTSSSLIIENISKSHAGIYLCRVKNTLKYTNGSSIEKFNQSEIQVIVQYAPRVTASSSIIAVDQFTGNVALNCEIDSFPEAKVFWKFNQQDLVPSSRYMIVQNQTSSSLIVKQIQSIDDYGIYTCHAINQLADRFVTIQLRSKDVPEPPTELNITSRSYSSIGLHWKPGFDGGWPQIFSVLLNERPWQETNQTYLTLTNLQHGRMYNISVRSSNRLGQSHQSTFLTVQTDDVPIRRENLPNIEFATMVPAERKIHYRIENESFANLKLPLCLRIEIQNQTHLCPRLVTSTGVFSFDQHQFNRIENVSLCLDLYDQFCGTTIPLLLKNETSISWIFILIASVTMVSCLILFGLGIFCCVLQRKRRRRNPSTTIGISSMKKSSPHPIVSETNVLNGNSLSSPKKHFSNVTFPEQQQTPSSYTKLADIHYSAKTGNHRQLSSIASGSSDPILSNPNTSSLSESDHLTGTDLNPTEMSSIQNDLVCSSSPYISFGFPVYSATVNETTENPYSTPIRTQHSNKKTVYEVVV